MPFNVSCLVSPTFAFSTNFRMKYYRDSSSIESVTELPIQLVKSSLSDIDAVGHKGANFSSLCMPRPSVTRSVSKSLDR
jgi:hypothetical protein